MVEHRDIQRCTECGGSCCKTIYANISSQKEMEEWILMWEEEIEAAKGDCKIEPIFDPMFVHQEGNEHWAYILESKGLDPYGCQYLGHDGCILPWENRPMSCKQYRCKEWLDECNC
jgi:hypothetical protein